MIPKERLVFSESIQEDGGIQGLVIEASLICQQDNPVGYVGWMPFGQTSVDFCVLNHANVIFVDPDIQGQGIGYHLFTEAIQSIHDSGYRFAYVSGIVQSAVSNYQQWIRSLHRQDMVKQYFEKMKAFRIDGFELHL